MSAGAASSRRGPLAVGPGGRALAVALLALAAAAGCSVQPTTGVEALAPVPPAWTMAPGVPGTAGADAAPGTIGQAWWLAIDDPLLHRLADAAGEVAQVRVARERQLEAVAALRGAQAALGSLLTGSLSASRSAPGDDTTRQGVRSASLAVSQDLDVSGALAARAGAAAALAEARAEGVEAARIEARALAVRLYATHAGAVERRAATQESVRAFEAMLALAAARTRAGLATELDVAQARSALAAARAQLPRLEAARDSARLGLESLLGLPPGALAADLAKVEATPAVEPAPLLRTPLQVVAARPDLRAAERELAAAAATTSAAVRDRWPRLALDASLGVQAVRVASPFAGDGLASSLLAGLAGPLFDAGRLEARAEAARARERAASIAYRQAALAALSEVEVGLSDLRQSIDEARLVDESVAAASARAALARARWRGGLVPFLDVVLAEQALHAATAERALARSRALDAFARLSAATGLGAEATQASRVPQAPRPG